MRSNFVCTLLAETKQLMQCSWNIGLSINDEHVTSNTLPADSNIGQFHIVPVNLTIERSVWL